MKIETGPSPDLEQPGEDESQGEAAKPAINHDELAREREQLVKAADEQAIQDSIKADKIIGSIMGGATGPNLREAAGRVAVVAALAGGVIHGAEAVPASENTQKGETPSTQQEQREQKSPVVRGVASDPVLGQFTVEANLLGTKRDGTFGFEFEVVINGEQKVVQSSRRLRNGATFIAVEGGIEINVPAKYGAGSGNPDTLTVIGKDGNPVKMNIERR